jgi:hypothetical protein
VIFRPHQFRDYVRQHYSCTAIVLFKVTVFCLYLSWLHCSLVISLRVWYALGFEVLEAVVMLGSVRTVVAPTTGRKEASTENNCWVKVAKYNFIKERKQDKNMN